jgi:hypothetical protein
MTHHFIYALGWDYKKYLLNAGTLIWISVCFECSALTVLSNLLCVWYLSLFYILATGTHRTHILGVAEWTTTFLKVTGKGVVGVGQRDRWQQFGRIL